MRAEARAMMAGGGAIVNTSSRLTTNGFSRSSIDSAMKGAIDAMTRAAASSSPTQEFASTPSSATDQRGDCVDRGVVVLGRRSGRHGQTIGINGHRVELRAS